MASAPFFTTYFVQGIRKKTGMIHIRKETGDKDGASVTKTALVTVVEEVPAPEQFIQGSEAAADTKMSQAPATGDGGMLFVLGAGIVAMLAVITAIVSWKLRKRNS